MEVEIHWFSELELDMSSGCSTRCSQCSMHNVATEVTVGHTLSMSGFWYGKPGESEYDVCNVVADMHPSQCVRDRNSLGSLEEV